MDIAETIKFRDICKMLEKLRTANNEADKLKYLQRYYESFKSHRERFRQQLNIADDVENGNTSFYCVLRCIIPRADRAREPYGLQITTLGKVYIKVLQLSTDSSDAQRLYARSYSGIRGGDYADVVYSVLKPRCRSEPSNLNMKLVHNMLDSIASDDRRNTEKELTKLYETASALEQKWFIRLLLKSMHLGVREGSVLSVLHKQAREAYQRCSDLARVCCMVANRQLQIGDGDDKKLEGKNNWNYAEDSVEPFQHIRPMLCEIFPGNIETLMSMDVLYMETKMDGERFQLHYKDEHFQYISRNGIDYTSSFGADYVSGTLTPQLINLLPVGVKSIILDGEMMVWDIRKKGFRVKAENTDVKHLRVGVTSWRPCFVAYDLLYLDGRVMLDLPYLLRSHKLRDIIKEEQGVLHTMKAKKITSKEEFGRMFQAALNDREEGVVIKKQNALYKPGARAGGGWYKVKADYIKGLTTEFDLLIMGGFYNHSRTYIKSFLLGVLKYISPQEYNVYSVGKVANILLKRATLNEVLREYWQEMIAEPPPIWYNYKNNLEGRPDVWIEPRHSTILQIKAADLAPSSEFMLEKSLHFPRIQAWRNDKVWNECMTLEEFQKMCKDTQGVLKITKRELRLEDFTTERKRLKITAAQARKMSALVYEHKIDPREIEKISDFLRGFSFCILSTKADSKHSISDLKRLVASHGGENVENPLPTDPSCISIAGDLTYRVKRLQKTERYNIATMAWLLEVCHQQQMKLKPNNMISMTRDLRVKFKESFDSYGDSYTECVRISELEALLNNLDESKQILKDPLGDEEIFELESALFRGESPNYFRNIFAVFYDVHQPRTNLALLKFRWRGGHQCVDISKKDEFHRIDYVFLDVTTADENAFNLWLKEHVKLNVKIVNIDWILQSDRDKLKLDISQFLC